MSRAVADLAAEGTVVLLAGRNRDHLPSALVPRLVGLFGLQKFVRIIPAVKTPSVLYAAADAMVLPSIAEGMPNVILEAHLSEVPVVVTPEANRDILVADGDTGLVVPSLSPRALADQMARMMSLSPEARLRMGRNGRTDLLRRLDSKSVARQLAGLYDAALADEWVPTMTAEPDVSLAAG
jgi:colanic acid/amylovoran biosynthesis glycosyltransferase